MLVRDNAERHRYEVVKDDRVVGYIDYKVREGRYWFVHTHIEDEHQGTGAAAFLVRRALDDVRTKGALVVPGCPFVAGWIRRHPDYKDIVDNKTWHDYKRSRQAGRRRTVRSPRATTPASNQSTAPEPCAHVPAELSTIPGPWPVDGCAECLAAGKQDWLHLRMCQMCGHVGCCDNSPGKHGTAHSEQASHPLIRSYEPGESWWYCYIHVITFEVDAAPMAPSYG
jgi:predicted GNAT family acetyltransferase